MAARQVVTRVREMLTWGNVNVAHILYDPSWDIRNSKLDRPGTTSRVEMSRYLCVKTYNAFNITHLKKDDKL